MAKQRVEEKEKKKSKEERKGQKEMELKILRKYTIY